MRLGNLESALEGEKTIFEAIEANVITNAYNDYAKQRPSRISRIFKTLSNYGMNYDDKVLKNMMAIPASKDLRKEDDLVNQSLYSGMLDNWKVKGEEEKPFKEKTIEQKRDILRKMAAQPELEDILDVMTNECIVYEDDESYICKPFLDNGLLYQLNEKNLEEIKNCIDASFYKLYLLLNWKTLAWDQFKRWLIDGVLAYEIIYDDLQNPHSIIGIIDIDPATLTKVIKDNVTYWVQFKDVQGKERILYDSQIVYIKYEDTGVTARQSYLERLIRPFNLYRIIEQAQVIWTVTQSSFKTKFTIPVQGMTRAKAQQTLGQAMNRYKEDISFNVETGELQINGKVNMPFNKEYWMPQNVNGTPEIETIVDQGPMLNDSDQIKYFKNQLYEMSKIPASRFDKEAQQTWFGSDPTSQLREEIDFGRFVTRLRNTFAQILLKPLRIQLALSIPDIKNDKRILDSISLKFNSYNQFEEMMNIEIMTKRVEFIGTMKDNLTIQQGEDEVSYFDPEFLIVKYLHMSQADLELNEKYKKKNRLKGGDEDKEGKGGGDEDEELGGGEDEGGSSETESSDDIDSEMLGDVEPESTETTQA
jgi:hypothetical protein